MKKIYSLIILFSFILMSAQAALVSTKALFMRADGVIDSLKKTKTVSKITDTRPGKPSEIKGVKINITPYKPSLRTSQTSAPQSIAKTAAAQDNKILSNVKVYPNPVADHLNLSYTVTKESNVTIKIMDVLGNEISTLLSQRLPAGEQTNSFPIASTFNSGYYFIRLIVGNETIVKRISIL